MYLRDALKDTLKAFDNSKNKHEVYEVIFSNMQKYVYSESVFNTLYIEVNPNAKKKYLGQNIMIQ